MQTNSNISFIYERIRNKLFYMIPERWSSIYLYATVVKMKDSREIGEMFFYYFPKSILRKNPINVYQIPQKFSIEENKYLELTENLYELIKKLKRETIKYNGLDWTNVTISIKGTNFKVEYNCDDLLNSLYTNDDRVYIWQHKYLDYPIEKFTKEEREVIENYLQEENQGYHEKIETSETFYQNSMHNKIQYDIKKTEEYIIEESVKLQDDDKNIELKLNSKNAQTYRISKNENKVKNNIKSNIKKISKEKEKKKEKEQQEEIIIRNQILKY